MIPVTAGMICTSVLRRQFHWGADLVPNSTFGRVNSKRNAARPLGRSGRAVYR